MEFSAGTVLGPYEVVSLLGAGGMGEVYRGKDPRLGREVAIKILPPQFSDNPDRVRRFEQEARAAGILNHPNILTIYDIGTVEGYVFIVSELLVGETLREKMGGSPLPSRKAIEYALQIAHGLAAAHERGIVHRDLKPENLFVTRDGRIKILDFGLAKLTEPEAGSAVRSKVTTMDPGTQPGMVLGTVGYMSPEQVRGQTVDHRSDIFTFGAILYEMLTGKRAFHRDSTADTLSAILKEDLPELSGTNKNFPPSLERIIRHCLEKNMEERFQSARDLAFDLEMISGISGSEISGPTTSRVSKTRFNQHALSALMILAALVIAFFTGRRTAPIVNTVKLQSTAPSFQRITFRRGYIPMARFAPDGQTIIYSAAWSGNPSELFSTRPQSPVSRSLGLPTADLLSISKSGEMAILLNPTFFQGWQRRGTLARVPIDGGAPREVLENVQDADWGPDGKSIAVARILPNEYRLEFPPGKVLCKSNGWINFVRVSPNGDQVAFMEHPGFGDDRGFVAVVDLKGNKKVLSQAWASESGLAWSKDGSEVWFTASKEGSNQQPLYGVTLSGQQRVISSMAGNLVLHDVNANGNVLLSQDSRRREMIGLSPGQTEEQDLSWLDWSFPRDLSDDGNWVLFEEQGAGGGLNYSVYLRKMDGSAAVRLGDGYALALSRDGTRALSTLPEATARPVILSTGAGEPKTLNISLKINLGFLARWFPDGKRILFAGAEPNLLPRLWVYDLESEKMKPVTPEAIAAPAVIAPDQRYLLARSIGQGYALYPIEGGDARDVPGLSSQDIPLNWSVDGKSVWVREGQKPIKIYRVNLSTGQRSLWKEIRPIDPAGMQDISGFYITPDGKAYIYTYRRVLSDLYLAKGLQ